MGKANSTVSRARLSSEKRKRSHEKATSIKRCSIGTGKAVIQRKRQINDDEDNRCFHWSKLSAEAAMTTISGDDYL